jgi:hypothetical protein
MGREDSFPLRLLTVGSLSRKRTIVQTPEAMGEQLCSIDDDRRGMPDGMGVGPAAAVPEHDVKAD